MYTKRDIINGIKKLGIISNDTLLVHSSMKAIGNVEGRADAVIDAFIECLDRGLLIFPTLTHKSVSVENPIFNPTFTRSDVGILTNIFMKRPCVYRSLHPSHSVAAIGDNAQQFVSGEEQSVTPCPKSGCWGKLYEYNAKIMFLGCSLTRNTFLHSIEEWLNIPNRLTDNSELLKVKMPDGTIVNRQMKRHNGESRSWDYYDKIEKLMLDKNIATEGKIGDARAVICNARKMADLAVGILKDNPNYFTYRD